MTKKKRGPVKRWYFGKFIVFNDPYIIGGVTKYHWTAKIARRLVKFWHREWKWILTSMTAITAIVIAGVSR